MPVNIKGKEYYTVAERLRMANGPATGDELGPPTGIKSIETELKQAGAMYYTTARVVFKDGRTFTGLSIVDLAATSPAERDAPVETSETSAVGRALAFAGYFGSPEGIAGSEELQRALARSEARSQGVIQSQPTTFFADETSPVTRMPSGGGGNAAPRPVGGPGGGGPGGVAGGASPAQVRYATKLWGDAGRPMPPPNFTAMNGPMISTLIDELKAEAAR